MSDSVPEPVGDLQTALAHTFRLLSSDPALAADQAREILRVVPDQPQGLQLKWASGLAAKGLSLADVGRTEEAIAALRRATALDPRLHLALRFISPAEMDRRAA